MRDAPWPLGLALTEGFANARTGRWVSLIVVVATAWVTAGVGLANALEVSALARAEDEWIAAGAFVMSVEPVSSEAGSRIDVAACERLARVEGILASFAVAATDAAIEPVSAPGTRSTLIEVSPGIYPFLGVREPRGAGVVMSAAAAEPTGLADGEEVTFRRMEGAGVAVPFRAGVVMVDGAGLGPGLEGAFLLPTLLAGEADSCQVRTDAAHMATVPAYVSQALAAADGSAAIVRPLLAKNTFGVDFATAYSNGILRWAWVAGALVLAALWAVVQRTRRARNAIYQTFGAHVRARLILQCAEWVALTAPGVVWGWGIATCVGVGSGAAPGIALVQITWQAVAAWCAASVAVVAVALIPVGTLLDALKDGP